MRHTIVTRAALGLGLGIVLSSLLFAWLVRDTQTSAPVSTTTSPAFTRRCAACHTAADLRDRMHVSGDARTAMDTFLQEHADATAAEAREILDHFAGRPTS
jgi:hypothetical protein